MMRTLSRHLPPASSPQVGVADHFTAFLTLVMCLGGLLICIYYDPVVSLVLVASVAAVVVGLSRRQKTHFEKIMAQRVGENICTFRRDFDLHQVDPWIVRAVHEEGIEFISNGKTNVALRASDRVLEDLQIDPEDLEELAEMIAIRAG